MRSGARLAYQPSTARLEGAAYAPAIVLTFRLLNGNATGRCTRIIQKSLLGAFLALFREFFLMRRGDKNHASLWLLPHLKIVLNQNVIAATEPHILTNFTLATADQSGYTPLGNFNLNAMETLA